MLAAVMITMVTDISYACSMTDGSAAISSAFQ
jgi:hypothetical protein